MIDIFMQRQGDLRVRYFVLAEDVPSDQKETCRMLEGVCDYTHLKDPEDPRVTYGCAGDADAMPAIEDKIAEVFEDHFIFSVSLLEACEQFFKSDAKELRESLV